MEAATMTPPPTRIILAGLGGQGVVFLTRLLAKTAVSLGCPVMISETHGMSQRGGSVLSHFKIGGNQAPLIRRGTADILLALDRDEAIRNLSFLRPGGLLLLNSDEPLPTEVSELLAELAIDVHRLSANAIALTLGTAGVANVVMAGFATAHPAFPLDPESVRQTLGNGSVRSRNLNLRALQAGFDNF